jgi:Zn-dependent protease
VEQTLPALPAQPTVTGTQTFLPPTVPPAYGAYLQQQGLVYVQPGNNGYAAQGMVYPQYTYADSGFPVQQQQLPPVRNRLEVPVGAIFGIPIKVHVLLPAVTLCYTILAWMAYGVGPAALVFWLTGPILWATVLVHELGHCLAARKLGGSVEGILLWPLGGLAYLSHTDNAKHDLIIAASGPMTHGPQAAFWAILFAIGRRNPSAAWLFRKACTLQLVLFLFNLAPAYPLDGGRILVDLMRLRGVEIDKAGRITGGMSLVVGATLLIWGLVVINLNMILIGAWIVSQAQDILQKARAGRLQDHPMFCNFYSSQQGVSV